MIKIENDEPGIFRILDLSWGDEEDWGTNEIYLSLKEIKELNKKLTKLLKKYDTTTNKESCK